MSARQERSGADSVIDIYDRALPQVYGYLLLRCGSVVVAEDLTAETFMAAVAHPAPEHVEISVAWLIGIARHKLVDHWRRLGREQRGLAAVEGASDAVEDPWDEWINAETARSVLAQLSAPHRTALTLRYLDGLPVAEVAELIDRSEHATETLLVRAKAAMRRLYREGEPDDG